jgi:hypothetical protein
MIPGEESGRLGWKTSGVTLGRTALVALQAVLEPPAGHRLQATGN